MKHKPRPAIAVVLAFVTFVILPRVADDVYPDDLNAAAVLLPILAILINGKGMVG
jgi:hypothetical protein